MHIGDIVVWLLEMHSMEVHNRVLLESLILDFFRIEADLIMNGHNVHIRSPLLNLLLVFARSSILSLVNTLLEQYPNLPSIRVLPRSMDVHFFFLEAK